MQQNKPFSVKGFLKTLSLVHMALFLGVALLTLLFYLKTDISIEYSKSKEDITLYLFPFLGIAGIFISKYVFNLKLKHLRKAPTLSIQLPGYMAACLMSYALIELPAFLNIIWFSKTGNMLYFAVALALVVYLLWMRPTKTKVETDLVLKGEVLNQFRKEAS